MCLPAQLYFRYFNYYYFSTYYSNLGKPNKFCAGQFETHLPCNNHIVFVFQFLYIFVWTWMLQKLCTRGYKNISWFLVMLPYITMFLLILLFILFLKS